MSENPAAQLPAPRKAAGDELVQSRQRVEHDRIHETEGAQLFSQAHTQVLGTFVYQGVSRGIVDPDILRIGCNLEQDEFLAGLTGVLPDFVARMKPRDRLEKLALEQLVLHHTRILALSHQASANSNLDVIKVLNEACEGASGSFRRLMSAFRDHRDARNSSVSVSIAQQQIVQNNMPAEAREKNGEQTRIAAGPPATVLPANTERPALPSGDHQANAAVEAKYRSQYFRREGSGQQERVPARRPLRGSNCPETVNKKHNSTAPKIARADRKPNRLE